MRDAKNIVILLALLVGVVALGARAIDLRRAQSDQPVDLYALHDSLDEEEEDDGFEAVHSNLVPDYEFVFQPFRFHAVAPLIGAIPARRHADPPDGARDSLFRPPRTSLS